MAQTTQAAVNTEIFSPATDDCDHYEYCNDPSYFKVVLRTSLSLDVCIKELRLSCKKIVHFLNVWLVRTKNMIRDGVDTKK